MKSESSFRLIEIESDSSETWPDYSALDPERKTVFLVQELWIDEYGRGTWKPVTEGFKVLEDAKKLLRSCRLTEGIEIDV